MNYGCIGEHLSHSFSRDIHGKLDDYDYILKEIPPAELDAFMRRRDFKAINVTIPYKQAVIPYLDHISDTAKRIGAVNTIVNRDGELWGYNTDFGGMKALIARCGLDLAGRKVLICGTGGTSRTAMAVAECLGAAGVYRLSRSARDGAISYEEAYERHSDARILINTTPCGMYPHNGTMAIDPARFPKLEGAIDAVYNPLSSAFVRAARSCGASAAGGLYMLVMQAVLAWEIFTGRSCEAEKAESVYRDMLRARENVVLIGMPASGKSSVGAILAEKLGRELLDSDALIVEKAGECIPAIFEKHGEAYFRELESEVIRAASARTGIVLATGGGAVVRGENVDALRQNGRLFWLDRPLAELIPTADRPLGNSPEALKKRYEERYPLYRAAADERIDGTHSAGEAAARILEMIE